MIDTGAKLSILVESLGRISQAEGVDPKGILGNVTLDGEVLLYCVH